MAGRLLVDCNSAEFLLDLLYILYMMKNVCSVLANVFPPFLLGIAFPIYHLQGNFDFFHWLLKLPS